MDEDGEPWADRANLTIRTSSPHLKATCVGDSPSHLLIRIDKAPKGDFVGQVILEGKNAKGELREQRIAVSARAVGPFIVAPASLTLSRRGGAPVFLVVRAEDPDDLDRLKVTAGHPALLLVNAGPRSEKLLSYRVSVKEGEFPAGEETEITLSLGDDIGETETVRVFWRD